jgi:hypothetical protein
VSSSTCPISKCLLSLKHVSSFLHPTATCFQKKNPSCHISVSHLHVEAMPEDPSEKHSHVTLPFSFYKPTRSPILDTLPRKQRSLKQEPEDVRSIQENQFCRYSSTSPFILPINKFGIYALFSFLFLD